MTVNTTCKKKAWATEDDALAWMAIFNDRLKQKKLKGRKPLQQSYRCSDCGRWHHSSKPKRE